MATRNNGKAEGEELLDKGKGSILVHRMDPLRVTPLCAAAGRGLVGRVESLLGMDGVDVNEECNIKYHKDESKSLS